MAARRLPLAIPDGGRHLRDVGEPERPESPVGDRQGQSLEARLDREARGSSPDLVDVPATVICALCSDPDCPGCENEPEERSRSGIVAIVAWERAKQPMFGRLWSTARSTTRDTDGFFELLPDGPILPALRFAMLSELLAAGSLLFGFFAVAGAVAPHWLLGVALEPASRSFAFRLVVLGLPAFAALLVAAHVAHALSVDLGATRQGKKSDRSHALRFGLYACGWDLVMGPLGAVIVAVKEGIGAALDLPSALSGLPTRATLSFLRGCYRLEGERARNALTTSYFGATAATLLFAVLVLAAVTALVLS
jgi:hypothetical protein